MLAVVASSLFNTASNDVVHGSYNDPMNDPAGPNPNTDVFTGSRKDSFPLRAGLSARIPVSERWSLTTGVDYSLYSSSLKYSLTGEKRQLAHYLGVPLRLDYTLASGRWMDVYLGGGVEGDWCLASTLAGERIPKDGFSLSLLGSAGLQFNLTDRLGLYLEPTVSWMVPSQTRVLDTWRTEHPFTFSTSAGLRFTFGRQQ